ncbi:hypothetical protein AAVH_38581 [Aphelenchoides avenae]|nr:hypothetical protein AAVH_38581 [Aphelenchus avenae]
MRSPLFSAIVFASLVVTALGGRVLVAYAHDSKSHILSMLPFVRRLAEAGHEVVVFQTTGDGKKINLAPANVSVMHLDLPAAGDTNEQRRAMVERKWRKELHAPLIGFVYWLLSRVANEMVDRRSQELVAPLSQDWDLVVLDGLFGVHAFGIAQMLNERGVPYVIYSTSLHLSFDSYRLGMGTSYRRQGLR